MRIICISKDPIENEFIEYCKHQSYAFKAVTFLDVLSSDFKLKSTDVCLLEVDEINTEAVAVCNKVKDVCRVVIEETEPSEAGESISFILGCSDYIKKPYSCGSLYMRLTAKFINAINQSQKEIMFSGGYRLDKIKRIVYEGSQVHRISINEVRILEYFTIKKNEVILREDMYKYLYKCDNIDEKKLRIIDTHVKNLRKRFPLCNIITIRNMGYLLEEST